MYEKKKKNAYGRQLNVLAYADSSTNTKKEEEKKKKKIV